ncbi:MAG: ATP-binding cassette domain-containing protein [Alphaproteobacteria bacterium]
MTPMSADLARLSDVTMRFEAAGPPALDGISAAIGGGAVTGLVGPDGAGKTTFLRLLTGLLLPASGTVEALGYSTVTEPERIRAEIGYMPQRFGLYEDLTVRENLNLYADLRGLPADERAATFERLLRFTDLARFERRLAGKLSGGMKQKLGLACALLRRPRLLLLDEPSVGVDPLSRRELWAMVQELTADGIGVLWSTAYLDEAERCGRVLLLNEGKLLFDGPPGELSDRVAERVVRVTDMTRPKRQALAEALDRSGVIDGVIQGRAIRLVMKGGEEPPDLGGKVETTTPRFEDGFVDILGGGPGGRSALAAAREPAPEREGAVIEAHGLTKRFGDFTAAENITFDIARGEIFGLLGPNGAGKSTTFKMLCGLLKPSAGEGRVAGFDLRRDSANARSRLGYMAQKFSLYGDLSVRQNLQFFAGVYGLDRARANAQIERMIEIFELGRLLGTSAGSLPLGFKQRLALAAAVMHEPDALFLDEPTSGVDPITRREFWTHINGLVEKGVTVLVTTHFMDEAEYCDRIALIYRGRAIASGAPDELKAGVASAEHPDPSLEDAFIAMIERAETREAA